MLLFIRVESYQCARWNIISIHLMLLFISLREISTRQLLKFQYISCYCLSFGAVFMKTEEVIFQYISCYCLSIISIMFLCISDDFNTSHVTVYRFNTFPVWVNLTISIHLMLLFIVFKSFFADVNPLFQYISCYCLS